jgi:hypothetical protein
LRKEPPLILTSIKGKTRGYGDSGLAGIMPEKPCRF